MKLIQSLLMGKKRKKRGKKQLGKMESTVSLCQALEKKTRIIIHIDLYVHHKGFSSDQGHRGWLEQWCTVGAVILAGIAPLSLKT